MNKIFLIEWYNEDDYGKTQAVSVIIQGKNMTANKATTKAKQHLKKQGTKEFNYYNNFAAVEVTNETILAVNYINVC